MIRTSQLTRVLSVTPECGNSPVFAVIVLIFWLISPRSNVSTAGPI